MFGELIKLRELGRLLKQKNYEAALELARDPAIKKHRKARDAADRARKALSERAESHRARHEFNRALKDVRTLLRDGDDPRARALEKSILADVEAREQRAQSLAQEKERARQQLDEGDVSGALDRLKPLAEEDAGAASFVKNLKERRGTEAESRKQFEKDLKGDNLEAAFKIAREMTLRTTSDSWERDYEAVLERACVRKDVGLVVRVIAEGRRRSHGAWSPEADVREKAAARILECVEAELAGKGSGEGEDLLSAFPLGSSKDGRAEELARVFRRLSRAERMFQEGDLKLADELAREALSMQPRCASAKEMVANIEKMQGKARAPLEKAREALAAGRLLKARGDLVTLLESHPNLGDARDLLRVVEQQEKSDLDVLAGAREQMGCGALDEARSALLALSTRRPDLEEVPVLLRDVERRARERRLEGFAEESRLLAPREAPAEAAAAGAGLRRMPSTPRGEAPPPKDLVPRMPFTLRVEERGDWFVHPGDNLVIGNSMTGAADVPILAAIGSRHARLRRTGGGRGRASYHLDPGPGKRVTRNRRLITEEVELRHGDLVSLAEVLSFTFLRPVPGNDTAALRLEGNFLVHGCNKVLLFGESGENGAIVIGPGPEAHVTLGPDRDRIEILREPEGTKGRLLARCPYGVNLEGGDQRPQVAVAPGMRVHTVDVDFFVDPV